MVKIETSAGQDGVVAPVFSLWWYVQFGRGELRARIRRTRGERHSGSETLKCFGVEAAK